MIEDERVVLDFMIKHELAVKQLYEVFSVRFPSRRVFWQRLSGEEQRHADRLGTLRSDPTHKKGLFYDSRLRLQAIKSSINYIANQRARAQEGQFSIVEALSVARDLESALIEKQFSKISNSVSKDDRALLMDLAADTERHLREIVEALDAEKR